MKKKLIPVLKLVEYDSGEAPTVYRLDKKTDAVSFFNNFLAHTEVGVESIVVLEEWSKKKWQMAVDYGRMENGEMGKKEYRRFIQRLAQQRLYKARKEKREKMLRKRRLARKKK